MAPLGSSEHIDAALAGALARGQAPGFGAAVVADGKLQCARAAGVTDAGTGVPLDADAAFLWFSMTKIVTATAAMRLVDRGLLALDDDVESLVPGVLPARTDGAVGVRHLLQHSAGIPNPPPIRWVRPASHAPPDPDAFLRKRFARVKKLRFEPGTRSAYTNLGYLLLGSVIAAASKKPFTDYVHDELLEPLRMHATSFAFSQGSVTAIGHQRLLRGFGPFLTMALPRGIVGSRAGRWMRFQPFLVNGAAYGGLAGPVTEAARIVQLHTNGGEVDGVRILSESAVREMQQITSTGRPFDHGLGWFRKPEDRDREPAFVEHYGGGGGYHNLMRLYPGEGLGIVIMGNSTSYDVDALMDAIAKPWLGR